MPDKTYNVLFLCIGNSARSIMAEAILNGEGQDRFRAFSAGSMPKTGMHPPALHLLEHLEHETAALRSKSWDEFALPGAPRMDFVFTVCDEAAEDICPLWPGQPITAHWGVADPARAPGSPAQQGLAFAETCKVLQRRISLFTSLPLASIDRMSLQREVGRSDAPGEVSPT